MVAIAVVPTSEDVGGLEQIVENVKFLLASGVAFTMRSLVNRIQRDFGLTFHDADSVVWRGAGEFWTINQTTGLISPVRQ